MTSQNDEKTADISYSILWLDASANVGDDNRKAQNQLRSFINHVKTFDNEYRFQEYIRTVSSHVRLILIVNGRLGQSVVPHIHDNPQISSIYVYCMDKKRNEQWAKNYSKVKAVTIQLDDLVSRIKLEQKSYGKLNEPIAISFFSVTDNIQQSTTGLNGQFIQYLLLIDVLLRMKTVESDKEKLINLFETTCPDDEDDETIYDFEKNYSSDKALWWYTRQTFVYQILNACLRTQDIDRLFLFRFFIRDIYEQLKDNQYQKSIQVYRGQQMATIEVKNLHDSIGNFISINSFFSTSKLRNKALEFISELSNIQQGNERVLFEINADPAVAITKPFADISPFSFFKGEHEVLFMIGSIFRIKNIYQDNDKIWIIEMNLCNDKDHHLKDLFAYMHKTYADDGKEITLLSYGRVLHQMGKYELAEKVYKRLLKELAYDDPSRSDLYYSLGVITKDKGDYDNCILWFEKTLQIKSETDPLDFKYIGGILNAMGDAYRNKEDYDRALESFNEAVNLFRKAKADNHIDMAYFYNNIGLVYQEKEQYSQALDYYEKSLIIKDKYLPPTHPGISTTHNNLGLIHTSLRHYDMALKHFQYSLDIQLKSLPPTHPDIAMTYENIGIVYEEQGDWKQAFDYYKNADTIYNRASLSKHPDAIKNQANIRRISSKLT